MTALLAIGARYWRIAAAGVLLVALIALLLLDIHHRGQRDAARGALVAEQAAHRTTVANYQAAATVAAKRDTDNLVRVQAAQQAITERVTDDYQDRLADSVAAYERLRDQADLYSGSAGATDVSAARDATCRAYANAACDALPGLLKGAQDNTDQLIALIAWSTAQGDVPVGDEEAK